MELPELSVRTDRVEKEIEREIGKREQSDKYIQRLIENVQGRYEDIARSFVRIETAFMQHLQDDKKMTDGVQGLDSRLRVVERLAWIAVGGLAVIAAMVGFALKLVGT